MHSVLKRIGELWNSGTRLEEAIFHDPIDRFIPTVGGYAIFGVYAAFIATATLFFWVRPSAPFEVGLFIVGLFAWRVMDKSLFTATHDFESWSEERIEKHQAYLAGLNAWQKPASFMAMTGSLIVCFAIGKAPYFLGAYIFYAFVISRLNTVVLTCKYTCGEESLLDPLSRIIDRFSPAVTNRNVIAVYSGFIVVACAPIALPNLPVTAVAGVVSIAALLVLWNAKEKTVAICERSTGDNERNWMATGRDIDGGIMPMTYGVVGAALLLALALFGFHPPLYSAIAAFVAAIIVVTRLPGVIMVRKFG